MPLEQELKKIILSEFRIKDISPADLGDEELLFAGRLGLDSLDAVELVMIIKKHYGIEIRDRNEARKSFESVKTLAAYIRKRQNLS